MVQRSVRGVRNWVAVAALLGATACGGGESTPPTAPAHESPTTGGEQAATEPAPDASTPATDPGTTPADPALVAAGQARFDRACGGCHPGGDEDVGPRILGLGLTSERMRQQIRQGSGRMRPISETRLPEAEMPAVLAYLQSVGAVAASP